MMLRNRLSAALATVMLGLSIAGAQAPPATAATCAPGVVTPLHASFATTRLDSGYDAIYLGYKIAIDNPNLWVGLSNFTGGVIRLANNQPSVLPSGGVTTGAPVSTYFMAEAATTTNSAQSHVVTLYEGSPNLPGSQVLCTYTNTISGVLNANQNNSNKVDSIEVTMSGAGLGATATVTVTGIAGNVRDADTSIFVPTGNASFPAGTWRLKSSRVVSPTTTIEDFLFRNGSWIGVNLKYTATYVFTAVGTNPEPAVIRPVQYIGASTMVVTRDLPAVSDPLPSVGSGLSVSKTAAQSSVAQSLGATVRYTVTVGNSGAESVNIDEVIDKIPTGTSYVSGSAEVGGVSVADPDIGTVGSTTSLSFVGPFAIPAGGRTFSYQLSFPVGLDPGTYTNAATALVGSTIVGTSGGSTPATAGVTVVGAPSVNSASATTEIVTPVTLTPTVTGTGIDHSLTCVRLPGPDNSCVTREGVLADENVGEWVVNTNGSVTFTPADGFNGVTSAIYRVTDDLGQTAEASLTVSVDPIPRVADTSGSSVAPGVVTLNVPVTFANGGAVTVDSACVVNPTTGECATSVAVANVGAWAVDAENKKLVTFTPASAYTGTTTITYVATTGDNSGSGTLTATVTKPSPPVVIPASVSTAAETAVTFTPSSSGTNLVAANTCVVDPADSICRAFVSTAQGIWQVNTSNYALTFTPALSYSGTASITYRVFDVYDQAGSATMSVSVSAAPATAPVITAQPQSQEVALGSTTSFSVTVDDAPGGQTHSFQWYRNGVALTDGDSVSGVASASLNITDVTEGSVGNYTVVITSTVTDSGSTASITSSAAALSLVAPTVSTVSPSNGAATGGTTITITGTGFTSGASVTVGSAAATSVTVDSNTQISATTPAGPAGLVNVTVTNSDGKSGSLAGGFTYDPVPAPIITGISPDSGTAAGGTPVTITGTNLIGATVTFGDTAGTVVSVNGSGTELVVRTPPGTAGPVDVTVSTGVGDPAIATNAFTYIAAPTISGVSPTNGSVAGGTSITITGSGFTAGSTVTIGGASATSVTVVSATEITATTPAGSVGATSVTVTSAGGSVNSTFTYTVADPTIDTQPSSQTVGEGSTASFSVGATPSDGGTLSYQWRKDSADIPGATSATYTIASTTTANAGDYSVVVTNTVSGGSSTVTSNAATLIVVAAPTITTQPATVTVPEGQPTTFTVVATGSGDLTYQWKRNGTDIGGATESTYEINAVTSSSGGVYSVVVTNTVSGVSASTTSNNATLTVATAQTPTISQQPASIAVVSGDSTTLSVAASVSDGGTLTYQWYRNGDLITGANDRELTINPVNDTSIGDYVVVITNTLSGATANVTSATAVVSIATAVAPTITSQPQSLTRTEGQSATFNVAATVSDGGTLSYQWYKGGVLIDGATLSSLEINSVASDDAGSYSVRVTNRLGDSSAFTDSTAAILTVASAVAPVISAQPTSQTIAEGGGFTLSVTATVSDGGTLSYQWSRNGSLITGATGATYTVASSTTGSAGDYTVVITNTRLGAVASTTSSTAVITIVPQPNITAQPVNAVTAINGSTTFSITATGPGLSYQWQFDGNNIIGATSSTLTIGSTSASDAGSYRVIVSSTVDSVTASRTSNAATLQVVTEPMLTGPNDTAAGEGERVTLAVSVSGTGAGTVTYQWQFNGNNIIGATGASLVLNSVTSADAGAYSVQVTNTISAVAVTAESAIATLTVVPVPVISTQPLSRSVNVGDTVSFSVSASGTGTVTYQWRLGSSAIDGATNPTITITSAQLSQAGLYRVLVTNTVGGVSSSLLSDAATLTVIDPVDPTPGPTPGPAPGPNPQQNQSIVVTPVNPNGGLGSLALVDNATTRSATLWQPIALVDSVRVPAEMTPTPSDTGVDVWGTNWRIEYRGTARNDVTPDALLARSASTSTQQPNVLRVQRGGQLTAEAEGFMPGTRAIIYVLQPPLALAVATVDTDGAFVSPVPIPMTLAPGLYKSQVNGYTQAGQVRSVTLEFEVIGDPQVQLRSSRTALFFDAKSSKLRPAMARKLNRVVKRIPKSATNVTVQVLGYVQPTRRRDNDLTLSTSRAMSVARAMARSGVKGKYYVSGLGRAKERSPKGRRVEVRISYELR